MEPFWGYSLKEAFERVNSSEKGLSEAEALRRLAKGGPNSLKPPKRGTGWELFFSQFKSPLILLLVGAAFLSFSLKAPIDASIILFIVVVSGLLGFLQERGALNALDQVLRLVESRVRVVRDGVEREIPVEEVVPGDVVALSAGDLIPADCLLVEAKHLFVDEASLTGESHPAEKWVGEVKGEAGQLERTNALFYGSLIASGYALALVMATAQETAYGEMIERIRFRPPETAFEMGVRKFGYFLMQITLLLVLAIFAFNIYFERPVLEAFLFSLALAVGLTPQLLPAIISVNLAHGAKSMAAKKVLVKRLASIENFGQMSILCTDKTGTITEGKLELVKAVDPKGEVSSLCLQYAQLNAAFQAGYVNPLDRAILDQGQPDRMGWNKVDEIPYDFVRKCLSVVFEREGKKVVITKGAVPQILSLCSDVPKEASAVFEKACSEGYRVLAVASGEGEEEVNLRLIGFLYFLDPLKEGIHETVEELQKKGVKLKIITGDHRLAALHVASALGFTKVHMATGEDLRHLSETGLIRFVKEKNLFAEIEPQQKEDIILALRKGGHVVGFLGDGINDVAALHSADVGISVESGADAAKEASDIVLLNKDLHVLREGVEEGRRTFINTLKYVYMATSANFGNMFSMAGASLFLSFLPLLPKQVLLTNLLTDFPEMAIASDNVDLESVHKPVKWDLHFIRRFMIVFGLLSSLFDYATFGVLLFWLRASPDLFRTGWFIESVMSATLVVLVIRTRRPFFQSFPSRLLTISVVAVALAVLLIPLSKVAPLMGFVPLPLSFYGPLALILALYIFSAEMVKRWFFRGRV